MNLEVYYDLSLGQTHPAFDPTLVFSMFDEMLDAFNQGFKFPAHASLSVVHRAIKGRFDGEMFSPVFCKLSLPKLLALQTGVRLSEKT